MLPGACGIGSSLAFASLAVWPGTPQGLLVRALRVHVLIAPPLGLQLPDASACLYMVAFAHVVAVNPV